jgi:hypothetical protein
MKYISIEYLRVDLGIRVDKSQFGTLLLHVKFFTTQTLKFLIAKVYKYLGIQTWHACTLHTQ